MEGLGVTEAVRVLASVHGIEYGICNIGIFFKFVFLTYFLLFYVLLGFFCKSIHILL